MMSEALLHSLREQELLWEVLETHIPGAEVPLVRRVVGESLLQHNECVRREYLSLLEIHADLQQQLSEEERRAQSLHKQRTLGPRGPVLALLKEQIRHLVRELAGPQGPVPALPPLLSRDCGDSGSSSSPQPHSSGANSPLLATTSRRQQAILNFIVQEQDGTRSPTDGPFSVRSPCRPESAPLHRSASFVRPQSSHSNREATEELLDGVRAEKIRQSVHRIRQALEEERTQYETTISMLQEAIDEDLQRQCRISEIKEEPSLEEMRELHRALEENRQERDHRAYVDSLPTPSSPVHRRKFMPLAQGSSPLETTTTTTTPQPPQATLDFYGMFLGNGVVAEPETGCDYASQVLPAQAPGPPPPARPPTPPHVLSKSSSSSSSSPPPPPPLSAGQQVPPGDSGSRNVRNSTHASAGGDRKSLSSRQSRVLKLRSVVQENRAKKEQKQRVALDPQIQD